MRIGNVKYTHIKLTPRTIPGMAIGINVMVSSQPLTGNLVLTVIHAITEVSSITRVAEPTDR